MGKFTTTLMGWQEILSQLNTDQIPTANVVYCIEIGKTPKAEILEFTTTISFSYQDNSQLAAALERQLSSNHEPFVLIVDTHIAGNEPPEGPSWSEEDFACSAVNGLITLLLEFKNESLKRSLGATPRRLIVGTIAKSGVLTIRRDEGMRLLEALLFP